MIISSSDIDLKRKERQLNPSPEEAATYRVSLQREKAAIHRASLQRAAIGVFRRYYLERRHYSRVLMKIDFTITAILLFFQKTGAISLTRKLINIILFNYVTGEQVLAISYMLIWISFVIAEIIIYLWRRSMYGSLKY
jgi:hypothetical protein